MAHGLRAFTALARGPKLSSHHPHPPITSVSGDPALFSELHGDCTHGAYTHIQVKYTYT